MWRAAVLIVCAIGGAALAAEPVPHPFYSAQADAVRACARTQAQMFRYDYNRPEVSMGAQIAELMKRACGKEVEALAKLVPPGAAEGGLSGLGELEWLFWAPFYPQVTDAPPAATPTPGHSRVANGARFTYFRAARGWGPEELVRVTRTDAVDLVDPGPNTIIVSSYNERFVYSGKREEFRYSYAGHSGPWSGELEDANVSVRCQHYNHHGYRLADGGYCELRNAAIRLRSTGKRFHPLSICNPGEGDLHLFMWLPANADSLPAREARLAIDGGAPIALPDGAACRPLAPQELAQMSAAKTLRSSYIREYDTAVTTVDLAGNALAVGLKLFERLHALSFDARTANEMEADQRTLYARALPYTMRDALEPYDAWPASVACVARRAAARGVAADAAMNDPACADWLGDLTWRAARFGVAWDSLKDEAMLNPRAPAKITEARALVAAEAAKTSTRGVRMRFAENETSMPVMGHRGFSGLLQTPPEPRNSGHSIAPFGYAIEGHRAWGVVPGLARDTTPSIVITCDAQATSVCTLRVPLADSATTFDMHSDGSWHGALLCFKGGDGKPLALWRLFVDGDLYADLDTKGCASERRALVARTAIDGTAVLGEPGANAPKGPMVKVNVTFALALTRFLAERVKE